MPRNTSITVGEHFERFISEQLTEGRYGSTSEVIRAALRLLEERESKIQALRRALRDGEDSGFETYSLESVISELDASTRRQVLILA
jgi:antitoxin ParD1/3/4